MHIFRVSLLDYATAFDLDIFASTQEEARAMAMNEEPKMNITKVVCLTTIESIWQGLILLWNYTMVRWQQTTLLGYIFMIGAIQSDTNGKLAYISLSGI